MQTTLKMSCFSIRPPFWTTRLLKELERSQKLPQVILPLLVLMSERRQALDQQPALTKQPASSISDSDILSKRDNTSDDVTSVRPDDLCDAEPEPFSFTNWFFRRQVYKPTDVNAISTRRSVYDDTKLAQYYWPKPEYENIHRFDVKARWTFKEERVSHFALASTICPTHLLGHQALVRKIDWRVMLWGE